MVVTPALVSDVSRGQIIVCDADVNGLTMTRYEGLREDARVVLDVEKPPNLPDRIYDRCHALLICHLWTIGDPNSGLRSYSDGDFSGSQDPGSTTYLIQYKGFLETFSRDEQTSNIGSRTMSARADADLGCLSLDRTLMPRFFTE